MKLTDLEVNEYQVYGGGPRDSNNVTIQRRPQLNGTVLWALYNDSWCIGKDGDTVFEPSPSNRTEAWIENHRFESAEAALACYEQNQGRILRREFGSVEYGYDLE